ncbi:S41 family peptidase [Christiangramia sp. OXR-203]|uniref:S41 family peptidase n=1 Tax=Christiangramia sp. OXR-203 TaxID=3100176 RepID=UPI002AC8CACB|nr:S41 family peptidase [Christiangramia sp. OXR-203]WPY97627.1 S41 family peptidase [Christiangramia sp. OXR-203]
MKKIFLLIFILSLNTASSQNECNCADAMQKIISQIENDYPGFQEKTKDTLIYNSLKKQLISESEKTNNDKCIDILKKYTSFFKDGHIWILPNEQDKPIVKKKKNEPEKFDINITEFKRKVKKSTDKFEGIWKNENYTVGIKKTGETQYTGFIIETDNPNWKPNDIKFQLNGKKDVAYYLSDHSLYNDTYELYDNYLLHINNLKSNFINQNIYEKLNPTEIKDKINVIDGFYFKKLTTKSALLRISSFNYPYVERIEKLIEENKSLIEKSENLIIDIRNNGGGTDNAYADILPLIITNPIRNIGVELLSTQGLIDGVTKYKNGLEEKDSLKNKSKIQELDSLIFIYKQNLGKFINLDEKTVEIDTIKKAENSPKEVIILTNSGVGSSAENFVLKAKQSKKVKILGTPTAGVLDYANAYFFKFGCDNYKLLLPTYKSLRLPEYPIDNIGIQPDVYLDETVGDWVQYAIDYLE